MEGDLVVEALELADEAPAISLGVLGACGVSAMIGHGRKSSPREGMHQNMGMQRHAAARIVERNRQRRQN